MIQDKGKTQTLAVAEAVLFPNIPTPPAPPIPPPFPVIPARVGVTPTTRGTETVAATTSSTGAGTQSGVGMNTGITQAGTRTTTGSGSGGTSATSSTVQYNPNDNVVRMFDGSGMNCKKPIYLNDLVRSWNRP